MLIDSIKQTLLDSGKQAMSSKYPNDFEFYMIALELVSVGTGKTLKYFVFPVMPNSMSNQKAFNTFIQQTYGGVSVNTTSVFTPFDISLIGDFGKGLKILIGETLHDVFFTLDEFNSKVKTGYGCVKMLENILCKSF